MTIDTTGDLPRNDIQSQWHAPEPFDERQGVTARSKLEELGIPLPAADTLSDEELGEALWRVLDTLTELRIFLLYTDHLDDRELYNLLLTDVLDEDVEDAGAWWSRGQIIDLLGRWDQEDHQIFLRYYADAKRRPVWAQDWPEDRLPPSEEPIADRDRLLPCPLRKGGDR